MKNNIKEMIEFCGQYRHIFLYKIDDNAEYVDYLQKFLAACQIETTGIILPNIQIKDNLNCKKDSGIYYTPEEIMRHFKIEQCGVILSVYDFLLNIAYAQVIEAGICNIFFMSEYYKNHIPEKMKARSCENFIIEVNLADHCNLNCQMCDHFSPLAGSCFADIEVFTNDMSRLAELSGNGIGLIKLLGGEPLLNDNVPEFLITARALFPHSQIELYTNGLLLADWETKRKVNLWKLCRILNVEIMVTTYPIAFDYSCLDTLARKYDTPYQRFVEEADKTPKLDMFGFICVDDKKSVHHPFDVVGERPIYEFIDCYHFNRCITLVDGKLYSCPIIPYSKYFSVFFDQPLYLSTVDGIDIYAADNFQQITDFLTQRIPFCRYCKVHQRQGGIEFKLSKKSIEEWT